MLSRVLSVRTVIFPGICLFFRHPPRLVQLTPAHLQSVVAVPGFSCGLFYSYPRMWHTPLKMRVKIMICIKRLFLSVPLLLLPLAVPAQEAGTVPGGMAYPQPDCVAPQPVNMKSPKAVRGLRRDLAAYRACTEAYIQAASADIGVIVERQREALRLHNEYVAALSTELDGNDGRTTVADVQAQPDAAVAQ